jgi:hypothetical protein
MPRRRKEATPEEPTTYQALAASMTVYPAIHIEVRPVYSTDRFAMHLGSRPFVEHGPYMGTEDRGTLEGAYAIVTFVNRSQRIEYFVGAATEDGACRAALNRLAPWLNAMGRPVTLDETERRDRQLARETHAAVMASERPTPPEKTHPLFVTDADEDTGMKLEDDEILPDTEPLPSSDTAWRDAGR